MSFSQVFFFLRLKKKKKYLRSPLRKKKKKTFFITYFVIWFFFSLFKIWSSSCFLFSVTSNATVIRPFPINVIPNLYQNSNCDRSVPRLSLIFPAGKRSFPRKSECFPGFSLWKIHGIVDPSLCQCLYK